MHAHTHTRVLVLAALLAAAGPAAAQVAVLGSLSREAKVEPGEQIQGNIVLKNVGKVNEEVKVVQNDYTFFADGRNFYAEPGTTARSNARWITLSSSRVIIPPGQTAQIAYSVQVPNDKALAGTYWSLLMVEPLAKESAEATRGFKDKDKAAFGIQTIVRYGVQIITDIGNAPRAIKFADKKLAMSDGQRVLQLDVENIGDGWLKANVWAELYSKTGGTPAGKFEGQQMRVFPGCSVRVKIPLPATIPKGRYKTMIVIDNGDENVFGAKVDLEL